MEGVPFCINLFLSLGGKDFGVGLGRIGGGESGEDGLGVWVDRIGRGDARGYGRGVKLVERADVMWTGSVRGDDLVCVVESGVASFLGQRSG